VYYVTVNFYLTMVRLSFTQTQTHLTFSTASLQLPSAVFSIILHMPPKGNNSGKLSKKGSSAAAAASSKGTKFESAVQMEF
jgi:hypothetical protein